MKYNRSFNFSAGPAMMPEPVLEEIRDEMMNYRGTGMCVMEMSHRDKAFMQIAEEAEINEVRLNEKPVKLALDDIVDGKIVNTTEIEIPQGAGASIEE